MTVLTDAQRALRQIFQELLETTASEPLTLDEEYQMQVKWRQDADKLTFIACVPLPPSSMPASTTSSSSYSLLTQLETNTTKLILPSAVDDPRSDTGSAMLGDVNLFLHLDADWAGGADNMTEGLESMVTGELELMIAEKHARGHGYGRSAILCLLRYVIKHEEEIVWAFLRDRLPQSEDNASAQPSRAFEHFFVKISASNNASICLFKSLGFTQFGPINPFGEVELRRRFGTSADKSTSALEEVIQLMQEERFDTRDYEELPYHLNR